MLPHYEKLVQGILFVETSERDDMRNCMLILGDLLAGQHRIAKILVDD